MVGPLVNNVELVLTHHSDEDNKENSSPMAKSVRSAEQTSLDEGKQKHLSSSPTLQKRNVIEVQSSSIQANRQRRHSARLTTIPNYCEIGQEDDEKKRRRRRTRSDIFVIDEKSPFPSKNTTDSAIKSTENHVEDVEKPVEREAVNCNDSIDQGVVVNRFGEKSVQVRTPEKKFTRWRAAAMNRKSVPRTVEPEKVDSKPSTNEKGPKKRLSYYTIADDFKYAKPDSEAQRGETLGSFICNKFPAIPTKKFGKKDLKKYGETTEDWTVQAVYPTSSPHHYLVIYEGWSSSTGRITEQSELEKTAAEMLTACQQRMRIIEALERKTGKVYNHDVVKLQSKPRSSFWTMEDVTYFHSNYHSEHQRAPIYYMTDNQQIQKFPRHICIYRNVIHPNAEEQLRQNPKGKSIDVVREEMREKNETFPVFFKKSTNQCPSKECQCDVREDYVYRNMPQTVHSKRLNYHKSGRLIVEECETRFIIECSDICKCDANCPARTVQRGQQVPLVITFEDNEKGFGVRAGDVIEKGQLVAEYTGMVRLLDDPDYVNENYLAECHAVGENLSIDALEKGNVSRFINHSCDPNSMFIEVHSRAEESSLLLPRIAVFATKRIEMGEEVTISYYNKSELKHAAERRTYRTSCRCDSKNCLGWLPTRK